MEKQRIKKYLEDGESTVTIRVLKHRAKKFLPVIEKDVSLLKKLLEVSS